MTTTVQTALESAMLALFEVSSSPEIDAEVLLGHSLGQSRAWLLTYQDETLDDKQSSQFQQLVERRKNGEPIAYILGSREFWSLDLSVNAATLIPRPETEILVEVALEKATELSSLFSSTDSVSQFTLSIADLGTGSGAIALALATELPGAFVTAVDNSNEALEVAIHNAEKCQLSNVEFLQSHWFESLVEHRFDLICSNPPYIETHDPHLHQGDLRFEPNSALASGPDGFFDIQHIIANAQNYLNDHGWLILEHGYQQAKRTQALLEEHGFVNIGTREDYAGLARITYGQKQLIQPLN